MKYDDASWHYGGDFPDDLPSSAGATHIGMFLAWSLLADLGGELHTEEFPDELSKLRNRQVTPGEYFIKACDEKFTDEDLNDEGNAFALAYFELDEGAYVKDYEETLAENLPSTYHVLDTWDNFDKLKPIIDQRFSDWKQKSL
jgi:hypothetical protein